MDLETGVGPSTESGLETVQRRVRRGRDAWDGLVTFRRGLKRRFKETLVVN